MSVNKEIENLAGYQQEAVKMSAFTSAVKQADSGQLTEEQLRALLDACDHSKGSYAEEATAEELRAFQEQYKADQKKQAKENRVNRWLTVASLLIAFVSMVAAIIAIVR